MPPLPIRPSTPAHIRALVEQSLLAFPIEWDLDRVAERGYVLHNQTDLGGRARWRQQSRQAMAQWALTKLATSPWLDTMHWRYLEPDSPHGPLDTLQQRLHRILEVADARLPSWRGKCSPAAALHDVRAAIDTIRRFDFEISFADVARSCPQHRALSDAIDGANETTARVADRAAIAAKASGEDPLVAFAHALRSLRFAPTPTLQDFLVALESKVEDMEALAGLNRVPPWATHAVRLDPFGCGREFGKYPKQRSALQRAVILSLAWDFSDRCRRPRLAMSAVVKAVCRTWFAKARSTAHIEALIRPVRRQAEELCDWPALPSPTRRKSRGGKD